MRIVAGHLTIREGERDAFVAASLPAVQAAHAAPGCHDFPVSADALGTDRVRIFEAWDDAAALDAFRGNGPDDDLGAMIAGASVKGYDVVEGDVAGGGDPSRGTQE